MIFGTVDCLYTCTLIILDVIIIATRFDFAPSAMSIVGNFRINIRLLVLIPYPISSTDMQISDSSMISGQEIY